MIMAETGETRKVVGRSKAIAALGPIPGRTPMRVPSRTPKKQNKRLMGEREIWNP
jgi:hypothetical protein